VKKNVPNFSSTHSEEGHPKGKGSVFWGPPLASFARCKPQHMSKKNLRTAILKALKNEPYPANLASSGPKTWTKLPHTKSIDVSAASLFLPLLVRLSSLADFLFILSAVSSNVRTSQSLDMMRAKLTVNVCGRVQQDFFIT
jgi:hypothetical protein